MNYQIIKRPRGNQHVKLFEQLKKFIKNTAQIINEKELLEFVENYEKQNNSTYLIHLTKLDLIILEESSEEEVIHFHLNLC